MARVFNFEFEIVYKSLRQLISVFAWTWAIFVFILSYFSRGDYNHINNNNDHGPPPLFQFVFVPVLKVLVVAPSAFGFPANEAGNHASVQAGQFNNRPQVTPYNSGREGGSSWGQEGFPQRRTQGQLCAGCLDSSEVMGAQGDFADGNRNLGGGGSMYNTGPGFGYSYDVQLTQPPSEWGQVRGEEDQNTVQHLQMNDDGQYSFSYNSADSSRQEQRNLDGSVTGNYGYTDPTGQQVQVQYRANSNEGFHAFGSNIPQGNPSVPLPVPVQDTPEVQAARAQFFRAYDQQMRRIQQETEARAILLSQQKEADSKADTKADSKVVSIYSENAKEEPSKTASQGSAEVKGSLASASDFKNLPEPIAKPDSNSVVGSHSEVEEDDELDNDAVVISSDDADKPQQITRQEPQGQQGQQGQGPDPSFQLSHVVGAESNDAHNNAHNDAHNNAHNNAHNSGEIVPMGQERGDALKGQSQFEGQEVGQSQLAGGLPRYFYYVSVGGSPHYVTSSNLMRSDYPTSLKATLVGAIPLSAVHDAQVPQTRGGGGEVKATPPVYLDFDKKEEGFSYSVNSKMNKEEQGSSPFVYGFIPGTFVRFGNQESLNNYNKVSNNFKGQESGSQVPLIGYPFFGFQK